MNIASIVDVGHLHPRGAAAGIGQQLSHLLPSGIILQDLHEEGTVHGRVRSQYLYVLALQLLSRLRQKADDAAPLLCGDIAIGYACPPAGGNQVVEAEAGNGLFQSQAEQSGDVLPVVFCQGDA